MSENNSTKATIIITLITVLGGVTTALITNWDKFSPKNIDNKVPFVPSAYGAENNKATTPAYKQQPGNNTSCKYPFASERHITNEELIALSKEECAIMRNEIYARKGYVFSSAELQHYFENQKWYKPIHNNALVIRSLSQIEQTNISVIKVMENSKSQ